MVSRQHIDFRISADACIFGAVALLILPVRWLGAAFLAAAFHEGCHCLALRLCCVRIDSFQIGSAGAVIETEPMGEKQEMLCALAGPGGSLLLVLLIRRFPILAICGGIQGLYNLLPVFPLDGGRALRSFLGICCPCKRDKLMDAVEFVTVILVTEFGLYVLFCLKLGLGAAAMIFFPVLKVLARKIPCKEARKRVQ